MRYEYARYLESQGPTLNCTAGNELAWQPMAMKLYADAIVGDCAAKVGESKGVRMRQCVGFGVRVGKLVSE